MEHPLPKGTLVRLDHTLVEEEAFLSHLSQHYGHLYLTMHYLPTGHADSHLPNQDTYRVKSLTTGAAVELMLEEFLIEESSDD